MVQILGRRNGLGATHYARVLEDLLLRSDIPDVFVVDSDDDAYRGKGPKDVANAAFHRITQSLKQSEFPNGDVVVIVLKGVPFIKKGKTTDFPTVAPLGELIVGHLIRQKVIFDEYVNRINVTIGFGTDSAEMAVAAFLSVAMRSDPAANKQGNELKFKDTVPGKSKPNRVEALLVAVAGHTIARQYARHNGEYSYDVAVMPREQKELPSDLEALAAATYTNLIDANIEARGYKPEQQEEFTEDLRRSVCEGKAHAIHMMSDHDAMHWIESLLKRPTIRDWLSGMRPKKWRMENSLMDVLRAITTGIIRPAPGPPTAPDPPTGGGAAASAGTEVTMPKHEHWAGYVNHESTGGHVTLFTYHADTSEHNAWMDWYDHTLLTTELSLSWSRRLTVKLVQERESAQTLGADWGATVLTGDFPSETLSHVVRQFHRTDKGIRGSNIKPMVMGLAAEMFNAGEYDPDRFHSVPDQFIPSGDAAVRGAKWEFSWTHDKQLVEFHGTLKAGPMGPRGVLTKGFEEFKPVRVEGMADALEAMRAIGNDTRMSFAVEKVSGTAAIGYTVDLGDGNILPIWKSKQNSGDPATDSSSATGYAVSCHLAHAFGENAPKVAEAMFKVLHANHIQVSGELVQSRDVSFQDHASVVEAKNTMGMVVHLIRQTTRNEKPVERSHAQLHLSVIAVLGPLFGSIAATNAISDDQRVVLDALSLSLIEQSSLPGVMVIPYAGALREAIPEGFIVLGNQRAASSKAEVDLVEVVLTAIIPHAGDHAQGIMQKALDLFKLGEWGQAGQVMQGLVSNDVARSAVESLPAVIARTRMDIDLFNATEWTFNMAHAVALHKNLDRFIEYNIDTTLAKTYKQFAYGSGLHGHNLEFENVFPGKRPGVKTWHALVEADSRLRSVTHGKSVYNDQSDDMTEPDKVRYVRLWHNGTPLGILFTGNPDDHFAAKEKKPERAQGAWLPFGHTAVSIGHHQARKKLVDVGGGKMKALVNPVARNETRRMAYWTRTNLRTALDSGLKAGDLMTFNNELTKHGKPSGKQAGIYWWFHWLSASGQIQLTNGARPQTRMLHLPIGLVPSLLASTTRFWQNAAELSDKTGFKDIEHRRMWKTGQKGQMIEYLLSRTPDADAQTFQDVAELMRVGFMKLVSKSDSL